MGGGQALHESDGFLHVKSLCESALESEGQHRVRTVQLRVGEEQALLPHGPGDRRALKIVFVVGPVRVQELSLLCAPHPQQAQERVLGALPQLGPDLLDLVHGAVQIFGGARMRGYPAPGDHRPRHEPVFH